MQDLPDAVTVFLEIGEQSIDAGRRHVRSDSSVRADFFRASSGIFLKAAWALYSSEKGSTIAGDLQASEIAKTIILVVNGKEDVTVLFQSGELSPAFREHPELAVIKLR